MESSDRPYIDTETEPGDKGTEKWADDATAPGEHLGPLAEGHAETDAEGAIVGSPADILDDGEGVDAQNR